MNERIVGYITSSHLKDGFVSQQVQNLLIKNFLENQKKTFLLSWTEYKTAPSLVFDSLLLEEFYEGICFFSLEQTFHFTEPLEYFYKLKNRKLWAGFAREGLFFYDESSFEAVLKTWWLMRCVYFENNNPLVAK